MEGATGAGGDGVEMKHYYVFAVIQGGLVGFGCVTLLGPVVGLVVTVVMASWGVKSAYDMARDDQANKALSGPGPAAGPGYARKDGSTSP